MIERIIEMDKEAREAAELVQKDKINLEKKILTLKKRIRSKYISRAKRRLKKNKALEEEHTKRTVADIVSKKEKIITKLQSLDSENKNKWISEVCTRIFESGGNNCAL